MTLRRLDHALVLTDDLDATVAFYCDALGFEPGPRPPLPFPGHWLYVDGAACLHIADRAAYEAHAASVGLAATGASIDHVAFAAERYDDVAARLEAAGVDVVTNDVPDAAMRQIFLSDPNGVRIELNVT
jgi:catechol 2,3-dioxygenase-like lactoylglutathione lyase family enzyme